MRSVKGLLLAAGIMAAPVAAAQDPGQTATAQTGTGVVGQRQTRDQVAPNVTPQARLSSRLQTRIRSRINSRLDRNYAPQDNAASAYAAAEGQARAASEAPR